MPQYSGGFSDVWTGNYQGQRVAAKVLRVYLTSDLDEIRRVGHCKHECKPTDHGRAEVLQGGDKVESPQPSERVTTPGSDYGKGTIRDGFRMDAKREYQRVHQVPCRRRFV